LRRSPTTGSRQTCAQGIAGGAGSRRQQIVGLGVLRIGGDDLPQAAGGRTGVALLDLGTRHQELDFKVVRPAGQPVRRQGAGVVRPAGSAGRLQQAGQGVSVHHGVTAIV
jgi:hypothetical protein